MKRNVSKKENLKDLKDSYVDQYGFHMPDKAVLKIAKGLNEDVVRKISLSKHDLLFQ